MNYAGNTKIIGKHFHEQQENLCIAVRSIIPLRKTILFNKGYFYSEKIVFKDFSRIFHNSSIFKDMMLFQGPCEP